MKPLHTKISQCPLREPPFARPHAAFLGWVQLALFFIAWGFVANPIAHRWLHQHSIHSSDHSHAETQAPHSNPDNDAPPSPKGGDCDGFCVVSVLQHGVFQDVTHPVRPMPLGASAPLALRPSISATIVSSPDFTRPFSCGPPSVV